MFCLTQKNIAYTQNCEKVINKINLYVAYINKNTKFIIISLTQ